MIKGLLQKYNRSQLLAAACYLALIIFWALLPLFVTTRFWMNIFIMVFVKCVGAVSLRTVGLSGNMSFAHGAFMGVGSYTAALLANFFGLPVYLTIPIGAIAAMVIGVLTGFPFVRLRSIYFSMSTMFLGVAIVYVISALKITGGASGIKFVPEIFKDIKAYYYFFLVLAVVSCVAMYRFEFSRIGITLRALSQSPDAAAAMGVNETYFRLLAVGFGCFFVGLSGAAYAHYNSMLSPTSFGMSSNLWFIMYIMIGGQDKFIGPIIGAILLVIIPESSRVLSEYAPFITGIALILVAYFLPGGLASIPSNIKNALTRGRGKPAKSAPVSEGGE